MSDFKLLLDQPLYENASNNRNDGLGFKAYAEVLKSSISSIDGPFTIGIHGGWGTGKTSLMRALKEEIQKEEKNDAVVVWFNAWQYEKDDHLLIPLIGEIIEAIEADKKLLAKFKNFSIKALKALMLSLKVKWSGFSWPRLALNKDSSEDNNSLDIGSFSPSLEASIGDLIENYESQDKDELLEKSLYLKVFKFFKDFSKKKDFPKFIIFVDDLDRCMPDKAIELLEGLKLVLSQPKFIFVLGVAKEVLVEHLNYVYNEKLGLTDFRGESYLDKIIQLPFPIPPHSERINGFITSLAEQIPEQYRNTIKSNKELILKFTGNNPRSIIRFINNVLLDLKLDEILSQDSSEVADYYFIISRGLYSDFAWRIFTSSDLIENADLCRKLSESLREKNWKNSFENKLSPGEKYLANRIISTLESDAKLLEVLKKEEGLKWLMDIEVRKRTIAFIQDREGKSQNAIEVEIYYSKDQTAPTFEIAKKLELRGVSPIVNTIDISIGLPIEDTHLTRVFILGKMETKEVEKLVKNSKNIVFLTKKDSQSGNIKSLSDFDNDPVKVAEHILNILLPSSTKRKNY